jgi:hypothetical protein
VAAAWHAAASDIDGINARVNGTIAGLKTGQIDDTAEAVDDFWSTVYQPGNPRTVLAGVQQICQALGDACDKYASSVDAAHSKLKHALAEAGIAVGLTTALGVGLSFLTFGASDAAAGELDTIEAEVILGPIAAEAAETVAAETAAAVGPELVADVEVGAAETATIEAVEAETTEIETALDEEMAAADRDLDPMGRLKPPERASLDRLRDQFPDRDLRASSAERDGEFVDNQGRTYDQMGNPQTSDFWNARTAQRFYRSIDGHLLKSMDYTVIDLTGFSEQSIADITEYVDSLPAQAQAKIIRIGF